LFTRSLFGALLDAVELMAPELLKDRFMDISKSGLEGVVARGGFPELRHRGKILPFQGVEITGGGKVKLEAALMGVHG
jgi:hypothetical protein